HHTNTLECGETVGIFRVGASQDKISLWPSANFRFQRASVSGSGKPLNIFFGPLQRFNVREANTRPHLLPLRYSSLLGQCLRLVSYATGALPHLRLRAFDRRSSLPSLCYPVADNSVAAL